MTEKLDLDAIEKRALLAEIHAMRERLAAAEWERDEARAGCENSQNEDACGDCVHCLRVGMTAALDARAEALSRAETAEALVRELAAVVKEDRPRSYTEHANGMACGYPDSCWACRHDAALAGLSAAARKEIEG